MLIAKTGKPGRTADIDYDEAISKQKPDRQDLLMKARPNVLEAYSQYLLAGAECCTLSPGNYQPTAATALRANYDLTYSGRSFHSLRQDLLGCAHRNLCAMCGRTSAYTIDHHLPKENFPEFSIYCWNLVPVCSICNGNKRMKVGTPSTGRFLHPYFDSVPNYPTLLIAKILIQGSVDAIFEINPSLPQPLRRNALYHFRELKLDIEYPLCATERLSNSIVTFENAFAANGSEGVREALGEFSDSARVTGGDHYWLAALYDAAARSDDFCNGGFGLLRS